MPHWRLAGAFRTLALEGSRMLPKSPRLTPATLGARRANTLKSTGPSSDCGGARVVADGSPCLHEKSSVPATSKPLPLCSWHQQGDRMKRVRESRNEPTISIRISRLYNNYTRWNGFKVCYDSLRQEIKSRGRIRGTNPPSPLESAACIIIIHTGTTSAPRFLSEKARSQERTQHGL